MLVMVFSVSFATEVEKRDDHMASVLIEVFAQKKKATGHLSGWSFAIVWAAFHVIVSNM